MNETLFGTRREALFAEAERILRELATLDQTPYSDDETTAALRAHERLRNLQEPIDHALILEVERRGIAATAGVRTVPRLLCQLLDIDPGEARARHRAAEAAGARRSLLGEVLPPAYPVVAAAQADGVLSARQARIITDCVERLPDAVKHKGPGVEERLVGFARDLHLPPHDLAQAAQREIDWLDPDGKYADVEYRRRYRTVDLHVRPDGSSRGSFEATAELTEFLQVAFDALAAPMPAANGEKDSRTPGQRRHDAVLDLTQFAVRSGDLPTAGGVTTTVVLTMTEDQFTAGGRVRPHRPWRAGPRRRSTVVVRGRHPRHGRPRRRLRVPRLHRPTGWTQAHHIPERQHGGRTSIDDGCLLCGYHHREFERLLGWSVTMTDGRPAWTPPRWLDPEQKPIPT